MALLNVVKKQVHFDQSAVVKYQLATYCFLNGIESSDKLLNCLTELAIKGPTKLNVFCRYMSTTALFSSSQVARNAITEFDKLKLIIKSGKKPKLVEINPELQIVTKGPILLDFKFAYIDDTNKIQNTDS